MGIEKLKHSLLSEAKEEAQQIVQTAQSHVSGMLQEEKAREKKLRESAEKEIKRTLAEQRNERIAWARLEAKRMGAEAREDAINNVLEEFFNELAKSRKSQEYKKFMKNAKIAEDLSGLGGALVESADGRIRVDLRLETLVDTGRDEIRKQVAAALFGGK
jgi:vacuolar-type H+-ATPase subunit E/Vma4